MPSDLRSSRLNAKGPRLSPRPKDRRPLSETEPKVDEALAVAHGLKPDEYARLVKLIGRTPTFTELGIVSAMWNEHCSYKSSRLHLRKLPTTGPHVIYGPGENAGVIDIGDGDVCVFKMELHNHPSFIEPYQGAATGVGGILRDVFTMGARPVAALNFLRFGAPDHPKTRRLVAGVVAGIGGYGNSFGVPTVGGSTGFHRGYDGNILVNAMAVGVARRDAIFTSAATGVGNPIVYLGSKTGRDGIHGASMASAAFEADAEEKRPTVQVGDPFAEKLLLEACLELMASGAVIAIQDMGAAGLTSSAAEMGAKGDLGIDLDLDHVPCRETGMTAYEMMLSESQERMLMVLKPEKEPEAEAIFRKWGLDFAIIGKTTDTRRFVIRRGGEVKADLPIKELGDEAPLYDRPWTQTPRAPVLDAASITAPMPTDAALLKLLSSPDLCSKRWIYEQYDTLDPRQHGSGARRRRRGGAAGRWAQGPCADHRLHRALLLSRSRAKAESRRSRRRGATSSPSARARSRSPTISTSAIRSGPSPWANWSAASRALARRRERSISPSSRATSRSTTRRWAQAFRRRPRSAASASSRTWRKRRTSLSRRRARTFGSSAERRAGSADPPGSRPSQAARRARRRRSILRPNVATANLSLPSSRAARSARSTTCPTAALALLWPRWRWQAEWARTSRRKAPSHAFFFGEDQGRYVLTAPPADSAGIADEAKRLGVPLSRLGVTGGSALKLGSAAPVALAAPKRSL